MKRENLLDILTFFRRYFKATIDDRIGEILMLDNIDLKAKKFEKLKESYRKEFIKEYKSYTWDEGECPISSENLDEFAYEFVEDMFKDYYKSLKKKNKD